MNDFSIVVEISGLQQYLVVDEVTAREIIRNLERSINSTIKADVKIFGNFIVFTIKTGNENVAAVIEAAENLLVLINRYNEDLHEFSMMLIQPQDSDMDKFINDLRQQYFSKAVDRALLIENRIMNTAGKSGSFEDYGGYHLVELEEEPQLHDIKEELKQFIDDAESKKLVKYIVPEIDDETENLNYTIMGKSELVLRLNLDEAVRAASGKNHSEATVYIDCLENESDIIRPFIRSIDRQLLAVVDEYLDGVELKTWQAGKNRLVNVNSDYAEEYFFSIYCLYLKGIMKFFNYALQPQVIIFSGINRATAQFIRYSERILEYLRDDCKPTVFFLINTDEENHLDFELYDYFRDMKCLDCCSWTDCRDRCDTLNYQHTRLLFALSLTEGLFEKPVLEQFLMHLDFDQDEISSGLNLLMTKGCIINERYIKLIRGKSIEDVFSKITDKLEIYRQLAKFICKNISNDFITDYGRCASVISDFASEPIVADAVFQCLTMMLDLGQAAFVLNYLSNENGIPSMFSDSLELRCFLLENQKSSCLNILKGLPEPVETPPDIMTAMFMLEGARYYHAMSDTQRALDYIKKVLIFLQERDEPRFEGIAFIELGFLMLCKGKLLESSEYLGLAVEKLTGTKDHFSLMKAYMYTAVQQYIWGSLDDSMESAYKALKIADERGFKEWQFYIEFFTCRLLFELGRYYDAEKLLSECLLRSEIYLDNRRKKIFSAWTARACVYQGKIYRGINMLLALEEDPEVLFFLSEAYYFNGNMDKAVESIEKAAGEDAYFDLGFMPLEHINWKNGFSSIEGRVLRSSKGTGVLMHNIRALMAFLLGMTGNREYGTEILFSLTRDEKISENDPYNRLYFYLYCQLLESRKDTEMIDKITLISKALKYLQQTASRIHEPHIRQQFMNKNYWNSLLVNEARREKLI